MRVRPTTAVLIMLGFLGATAWASDYKQHPLSYWQQRLQSPEIGVRKDTVTTLVGFGGEAVPTLIGSLNDPENLIRDVAMVALVQVGAPAIPALIDKMYGSDDEAADRAAQILGRMGPPAIPALMAEIRANRPGGWRHLYGAAFHMSPQGKAPAVQALLEVLEDRDNEVRFAAMRFLGHMYPETERAAPAIIKWLASDKATQGATYHVLSRLGPKAFPALREGVAHPDPEVRKLCVQLLANGRSVSPEAMAELQRVCGSDPDQSVRAVAAGALRSTIRGNTPMPKC